jgi:HEPN domain-containing protein
LKKDLSYEKITNEWINKAKKDLLVVQREMREEDPVFDAVCFHSQQAVEKYLKAFLQENEIYFEKTHDLEILCEKCKNTLPEIEEIKEKLIKLSSYSVEVRYPGVETTKKRGRRIIGDGYNSRKNYEKIF